MQKHREDAMQNVTPPFRADHVGSLLRPAEVKKARTEHSLGKLDDSGLAAIEDTAIKHIIAQQQAIGLQAVTDGELRRTAWHWDFLGQLDGIERGRADGLPFKGVVSQVLTLKVVEKVGFSHHPMLQHFEFLRSNAHVTSKMCIPSPTHVVGTIRDWRPAVRNDLYPGLEQLFVDLASAYRKAIRAFANAGCTYLQIDDCNFAFLCDPAVQARLRQQGDDPDWLVGAFARLVSDSLGDRPQGMSITMHSCRGNFRSTWMSEGSWERVADTLFNTVPVDGFFLEYDSVRAGGFEPLRFVPKDKSVVLGLISSKLPALEPKDAVKRRIDEATQYVDLERLHISPQCGFASTEEGNHLTEDEQWRKLAHVVEIAQEVWDA
jgi:5-methyltetrahydropteroyltriglutamate--homocysteine methyltransferase